MNEWDDTPWSGTAAAPTILNAPREGQAVAVKAATGSFLGNVTNNPYLSDLRRSPQAIMTAAQIAYHRHPWVGTAEATVTRKVAGLPWHLEDENDEDYEEPFPPAVKVAFDLLEKPQAQLAPEMRDPGLLTGRALRALTSRHLGLCGMAYWYLDRQDVNGIPVAIMYVNPARVWPATTAGGRITGWVLDAQDEYGNGGTPLDLSELLPFYLDPPDRGAYGTGLFERIILKTRLTDLADQHAAYVIGTGGRLAGIVSPKDGTIPDEEFKSLVAEFRNLNEAPDAAKRTTVMRGPIDFTATGQNMIELGLLELAKMERDDIFSGWGVPPTQAGLVERGGGLNSGETRKFDEATLMQGAVHDRVVSMKETIQFGLLDRWQAIGVTIDLEIDEPQFDDRAPLFALAKDALNQPLRNDERRELLGYPPFGDPRDEEVWLPSLQTIAYAAASTPQPVELKAKPNKREFLGLRRSLDTRWVPQVKKTVADVLATQRKNAAKKVREMSPETLARQYKNPQAFFERHTEADRLRKALAPIIAGMAAAVGDRTTELLKGEGKADPFTDRVVSQVATKVGLRVDGITNTTQRAIAAAVATGFDEGLSPGEIADLIEGLPAFDEARAELVARTETAYAYNAAALGSYSEFGVSMVEPSDGDSDEECQARLDRGAVSLDEAEADEDHPNGTLDWIPIVPELKEAAASKADPMLAMMAATLTTIAAREPAATSFHVHQAPVSFAEGDYYAPAISPTPITVSPTPIEVHPSVVNVAAPDVHVEVASPTPRKTRKRVEYNADGRPSAIVEE